MRIVSVLAVMTVSCQMNVMKQNALLFDAIAISKKQSSDCFSFMQEFFMREREVCNDFSNKWLIKITKCHQTHKHTKVALYGADTQLYKLRIPFPSLNFPIFYLAFCQIVSDNSI